MTRFEERLKIAAVNCAAAAGADPLTQQKQRHTRAQHSDHTKKKQKKRKRLLSNALMENITGKLENKLNLVRWPFIGCPSACPVGSKLIL